MSFITKNGVCGTQLYLVEVVDCRNMNRQEFVKSEDDLNDIVEDEWTDILATELEFSELKKYATEIFEAWAGADEGTCIEDQDDFRNWLSQYVSQRHCDNVINSIEWREE